MIYFCSMTTRYINKPLLRLEVKRVGLVKVAYTADCSTSLIQKLMSEPYESVPGIDILDGICDATDRHIDEMFPRLVNEDKAS